MLKQPYRAISGIYQTVNKLKNNNDENFSIILHIDVIHAARFGL